MNEGLAGTACLVLVPTAGELAEIQGLGGLPESLGAPELCGFGPVAAAARAAELVARRRPRHVYLIGIAGTLAPERVPVGHALSFSAVRLDGVGVGRGDGFRPPSRIGFPQWGRAGSPEAVEEELPLADRDGAVLLTVTSASASPAEANERLERHPGVAAEDMEGFGVAFACHLARVPLTIVRGLSNVAGERARERWDVRGALAAARSFLVERAGHEP